MRLQRYNESQILFRREHFYRHPNFHLIQRNHKKEKSSAQVKCLSTPSKEQALSSQLLLRLSLNGSLRYTRSRKGKEKGRLQNCQMFFPTKSFYEFVDVALTDLFPKEETFPVKGGQEGFSQKALCQQPFHTMIPELNRLTSMMEGWIAPCLLTLQLEWHWFAPKQEGAPTFSAWALALGWPNTSGKG